LAGALECYDEEEELFGDNVETADETDAEIPVEEQIASAAST